jgi:hypothetical protein
MPAAFRRKLQKLTYLDFEGHDRHEWLTPALGDEELLAELKKVPPNDLFLGRYSEAEIKARLESHGITAKLQAQGFPAPMVEIRTDEVYTHRLYVYTDRRDYDHILIELRLREGIFAPREQFVPACPLGPLAMILVDWLMLQNPRRGFEGVRPRLPQQRHPGLGLLQDLIPLVIEVVEDSGRGGVLDVPEHYHGALFYSRWFRFFNPAMEGRFLAMQRDLGGLSLHVISNAIDQDCLVNLGAGKPEKWGPGEQILPICAELKAYFNHRQYQEARDRAFLANRYALDLERFERRAREEREQGESGGAAPGGDNEKH